MHSRRNIYRCMLVARCLQRPCLSLLPRVSAVASRRGRGIQMLDKTDAKRGRYAPATACVTRTEATHTPCAIALQSPRLPTLPHVLDLLFVSVIVPRSKFSDPRRGGERGIELIVDEADLVLQFEDHRTR